MRSSNGKNNRNGRHDVILCCETVVVFYCTVFIILRLDLTEARALKLATVVLLTVSGDSTVLSPVSRISFSSTSFSNMLRISIIFQRIGNCHLVEIRKLHTKIMYTYHEIRRKLSTQKQPINTTKTAR